MVSRIARGALVLALAASSTAAAQRVIYVDTDATGANDGSSWADAFVFLQDALALAQDGDEVWVAEGVYRPDRGNGLTPGDRETSFSIDQAVSIYGGFSGVEASREQADWELHPTILSADLLGNDGGKVTRDEVTRADNSRQVVRLHSDNEQTPASLEGLIIEGGHNGNVSALGYWSGGGIASRGPIILRNLLVRDNLAPVGGGAFVAVSISAVSPVVDSVEFRNNVAYWDAGGLHLKCDQPVRLTNVTFVENQAQHGTGGGLDLEGPAELVGSVMVGNTSTEGGGAFVHSGGRLYLLNGVVSGNYAEWGGGIAFDEVSNPTEPQFIVNSVFSGNEAETGGGILVYGNLVRVVNSTLASNHATDAGGAISVRGIKSSAVVQNTILWGNTADGGETDIFIENDDAMTTIASSLSGGISSPQLEERGPVINEDPLFVDIVGPDGLVGTLDDRLWLSQGSPAIAFGDNSLIPADSLDIDTDGDKAEPLPTDITGGPRMESSRPDPATVDAGAYEYTGLGSYTVKEGRSRTEIVQIETYPNPVETVSHIRYDTARPSSCDVWITDILGRLMRHVSASLATGRGTDMLINTSGWPSGVYHYAVICGHSRASTRVVHLNDP